MSGGISFYHISSSFSFFPLHFTTTKKKRKAKAFLVDLLYHTEHTFATFEFFLFYYIIII
ncbi:hypothetical protein FQT09_04480 [Enterococcus hirae]|nr:hypothetical protein [Enterococcus hirae]